MSSAEYGLVAVIVLVVAYLIVTPFAERTANSLTDSAVLIAEATRR